MKVRGISALAGVAVVVLALTGCANNGKAQAAFDACSSDDQFDIMKVDGSSVLVELKGDNAKIASGLGEQLDSALNGGGSEKSGDPSPLSVMLDVMGDMDCMGEQTNYPGDIDGIQDGEEWDGWKYTYEKGAGSEETHRFTAS